MKYVLLIVRFSILFHVIYLSGPFYDFRKNIIFLFLGTTILVSCEAMTKKQQENTC
jgi:hypothetical protein